MLRLADNLLPRVRVFGVVVMFSYLLRLTVEEIGGLPKFVERRFLAVMGRRVALELFLVRPYGGSPNSMAL